MIEIYTIQIAKWRLISNTDIELIDITAKSGIQEFAPSYESLMLYKKGEMSEDEYTRLYIEKMRDSYKHHLNKWVELESKPKIALACYCKAGSFCHRYIFQDLFSKHLQKRNIQYAILNEIM